MIKNKDIQSLRPQMGAVDKIAGVAPATTTTYNQAGVKYSSATQTYGGITGALFGIKPQMGDIVNT